MCTARDMPIIEPGTTLDRVRLLITVDPQYGIHRLVNQNQGPLVAAAPPGVPTPAVQAPTLWTNSYFVATVGGATMEVITRYVENQRNV